MLIRFVTSRFCRVEGLDGYCAANVCKNTQVDVPSSSLGVRVFVPSRFFDLGNARMGPDGERDAAGASMARAKPETALELAPPEAANHPLSALSACSSGVRLIDATALAALLHPSATAKTPSPSKSPTSASRGALER